MTPTETLGAMLIGASVSTVVLLVAADLTHWLTVRDAKPRYKREHNDSSN